MEMKRYAWASGGGVPGCRGAEGRGEEIKSGNGNETLRLGERGRGAEGRAAVVESGQRLNPRGVPVPEAPRRQRGGGSAGGAAGSVEEEGNEKKVVIFDGSKGNE